MNLHLKIATLVTFCLSVLFILICLSSNNWIIAESRYDLERVGLWKACTARGCLAVTGGGYAKAFLILSFIFGLLWIVPVAAVVYLHSQGPIGVLNSVSWTIVFIAVLQTIGMIHGTVIFRIYTGFLWFSGSFGLGWTAVILSITSAIICRIDHQLEPPAEQPFLERVRSQRGGGVTGPPGVPHEENKPPPYSPPQGAILPYPGPQGQIQTYQTPTMAYEPQSGYQPQQGYQTQPAYQPQEGYQPPQGEQGPHQLPPKS
ncbi:p53 apoptosis effector related to PMP-22-like [Ambystoma mexicanum]|uniref:p53 apoptosis effector related to PMP-22-like n=1 Tax=Ambystoma mexicanum TaxID=8296 RepID=UPI0037E9B176